VKEFEFLKVNKQCGKKVITVVRVQGSGLDWRYGSTYS
jgi:hypothetical protein